MYVHVHVPVELYISNTIIHMCIISSYLFKIEIFIVLENAFSAD